MLIYCYIIWRHNFYCPYMFDVNEAGKLQKHIAMKQAKLQEKQTSQLITSYHVIMNTYSNDTKIFQIYPIEL